MAAPRLPRLETGTVIGTVKDGQVILAPLLQRRWQVLVEAVESRLGALELAELNTAIAAANDAADNAQTAADTANTAASGAQDATDANARFLSISNSNVTTASPPLLSAADAGANATVTVANHVRHYADGTSANVTGGTVTGQPYSTQVFIYYDQASLLGGVVAYAATTTGPTALTTAAAGAHPDRHYVGSVVTPAALGAPVDGAGAIPPIFDAPIGGLWN